MSHQPPCNSREQANGESCLIGKKVTNKAIIELPPPPITRQTCLSGCFAPIWKCSCGQPWPQTCQCMGLVTSCDTPLTLLCCHLLLICHGDRATGAGEWRRIGNESYPSHGTLQQSHLTINRVTSNLNETSWVQRQPDRWHDLLVVLLSNKRATCIFSSPSCKVP